MVNRLSSPTAHPTLIAEILKPPRYFGGLNLMSLLYFATDGILFFTIRGQFRLFLPCLPSNVTV